MSPRACAFVLLALFATVCLATVPDDLSNVHNEWGCDLSTLIVRPQSAADVQAAVSRYTRVRSNGRGHSWNRPFFCATNQGLPPGSAVNVQLSTFRPFNIQVLEDELAVWVDAGVRTIDLINYLGDYVTVKAPAGYALGAVPWYVYQSIGGAVATGTHGSSLTYSSLSNQVLALDLVLANGTLVTLSPETHPFLMRAARVSVGRLGVITRVKFRIVKEQVVRRDFRQMKVSQYLNMLLTAQNFYKANGVLPPELNETEWFWHAQRSEIYMVSFTRGDTLAAAGNVAGVQSLLSQWQPEATTIYDTSRQYLLTASRLEDLPIKQTTFKDNLAVAAQAANQKLMSDVVNGLLAIFRGTPNTATRGDRTFGTSWARLPTLVPNVVYGLPLSALPVLDANKIGLLGIAGNTVKESSRSYIYQPEALEVLLKTTAYDQYEVAIPVSSMYECMLGFFRVVYGNDLDSTGFGAILRDRGLRSAALFRLTNQEDGLLSVTVDGPRLWINIEEFLFYNQGRKGFNQKFRAMMAHLRSNPACGNNGVQGGRLHWGKAGWPDAGCWRGDVEYPDTWCDFGCAVKALDPTDKFVGSAPDRWNWNGVDLDRCCGPDGFDKSQPGCVCTVNHARAANTCPPPPFYTGR